MYSKKDFSSDAEEELLVHTIEDTEYQVNLSKEIVTYSKFKNKGKK